MARKLISMKFDEAFLQRLDQYARDAGVTRTKLFSEMGAALLEGRMVVVPRSHLETLMFPVQPRRGCSPLHPAQISIPSEDDDV